MIRVMFGVLLWLVGAGTPALAGAWLREPGNSFLAVSSTTRTQTDYFLSNTDSSIYFETGVLKNLTLGADLNFTSQKDGHIIAFLRRPLGATDGQNRLAYELGIGARQRMQNKDAVVKLGLSFGRGFETVIGNGWIAVDSSFEYKTPSGDTLVKLDATFGVSISPRFKAMLQIQSMYRSEDNSSVDIIPSLLWEIRPKSYLLMGVESRQSQVDMIGIKVGFWREF